MTTQTEALKLALEWFEWINSGKSVGFSPCSANDVHEAIKEALAQPEQERCVGCEACIDTACGRDECPKGWPKAAQPEQELVEWGVDWGKDGNSVSIIKRLADGNIEVLAWEYAPHPPQRKPLTDEEIGAILEGVNAYGTRLYTFARAIEAAHGIKE